MPKLAGPKAPLAFANAKPREKEYSISDGRGLYMVVTPDGSKLWDFRYRIGERRRKLAIKGGFPAVSLKAAREAADRFRAILARGEDPADVRKAGREEQARQEEEARQEVARDATTFRKVAEEWMRVRLAHRSESTRHGVAMRFERNVFPWIGDRPISELTAPELLETVRKVEGRGKLETAHRVVGACGQVFRYAIATGQADRDIAADLRGALTPAKTEHRAALVDPAEFGRLLRDIDTYQGWYATKYALRLLPLVFTRPGELRLAQWTEIDFQRAQWDIPAGRMKMRLPHTVPLSRQSLAILEELREFSGEGSFLFPTPRQKDKPLSNVAVLNGLRRMGYGTEEQTAHGFRATARTLLDERLHVNPAFIEAQLAHKVADTLGTAYNRTQHLDSRREMMQTWADYLDRLRSEVDFPSH